MSGRVFLITVSGFLLVSCGFEKLGQNHCNLPVKFEWESTAPLISPQIEAVSIKDPTVVQFGDRFHVWATMRDSSWRSVYLSFRSWDEAGTALQYTMSATAVGDAIAPQVFYYRPHEKWYMFSQWERGYSTTTDISDVNSWTDKRDFLTNGPPHETGIEEIDYWVICDDTHCHLYFAKANGVLYHSKTPRENFPNFDGYDIVMEDHGGDGKSLLFAAPNVYKVDGTGRYLLLVQAYDSTNGFGPNFFRSWTSTSLDGPWKPLADTRQNPFAGYANVQWPDGMWARDGIGQGELIRSGYDEYLTVDPCNLQFLYQSTFGQSSHTGYEQRPYRLGLLKLKR